MWKETGLVCLDCANGAVIERHTPGADRQQTLISRSPGEWEIQARSWASRFGVWRGLSGCLFPVICKNICVYICVYMCVSIYYIYNVNVYVYMKVKEESEKVGLKLNIQKKKFMAFGPITPWEIDGERVETVSDFIFWSPKSLQMVTAAMKLKDAYSLEEKL